MYVDILGSLLKKGCPFKLFVGFPYWLKGVNGLIFWWRWSSRWVDHLQEIYQKFNYLAGEMINKIFNGQYILCMFGWIYA